MKKVQIGARVSKEDADFLNLLKINGATTPSDKLRAIIEEARLRREYSNDFSGSFKMIQEQTAPITERVKQYEYEMNIHSALLTRLLEWLPEFYAYSLSCLSDTPPSKDELVDFEKGAVDRVVRLFESLLHVELSTQENSYQSDVLQKHIPHLSNLIHIVNETSLKKEKLS